MVKQVSQGSSSKAIKTVAARVAPKTTKSVSKQVGGFANFLREYGVVALAVGFVFGAQVKTVVDQFTASVLNPVIGLLLPGKGGLSNKIVTAHVGSKSAIFAWGALVDSLISFILIAAIIYYVIKAFRLDKLKN